MDADTRERLRDVTYEEMGASPDVAEALRASDNALAHAMAVVVADICDRLDAELTGGAVQC